MVSGTLGALSTSIVANFGAPGYQVNPAYYVKPPYRSFSVRPPYRNFYAAAILRNFYVRIMPILNTIPMLNQLDPREEVVITLDGTALLAGATFTGTPTVTVTTQIGQDSPPALQISGVIVNSEAITVGGVPIAVGQAIQMVVSGGMFGSQYLICAVCETSNPDNTWALKAVLPMAAQ